MDVLERPQTQTHGPPLTSPLGMLADRFVKKYVVAATAMNTSDALTLTL